LQVSIGSGGDHVSPRERDDATLRRACREGDKLYASALKRGGYADIADAYFARVELPEPAESPPTEEAA
jgi:hypothetical protein